MAQYRIVSPYQNGAIVVCLYLITDTIDFNKHVHDIDFFIINIQELVLKFNKLTSLKSGLALKGDSGEEVAWWWLTSLSRWSKAKFKSPCNFEELPYVVACVFSPLVIYEKVDIVHMFIEI
jgi:hypothetical protein